MDIRIIGVRSPVGLKGSSVLLIVQTGSGAYPSYCTVEKGEYFPAAEATLTES